MGMVIGAVASALYIVDAHRRSKHSPHFKLAKNASGEIAIEAFTCLIIFKNFFSFGLTFSAYHWLVQHGTLRTFMIIASVQVVICLLSIPMCKSLKVFLLNIADATIADVFGKRNRSFFHRHDLLKMTKLD